MALSDAQRRAIWAKQQRDNRKVIGRKQEEVFFPKSYQLWHPTKSSPSHYPDKYGNYFGGRRASTQSLEFQRPRLTEVQKDDIKFERALKNSDLSPQDKLRMRRSVANAKRDERNG